jgi:RHS repeat-associated protein
MPRFVPSVRVRTVVLTAIFSFATFAVQAIPTSVPLPLPRPAALRPPVADALACASDPSFEGRITSSSSSTTALTRSTTGNVYGYISDVVDNWSCTAYPRYDGLAWARDDGELDGDYDWGTIISSTSVSCNWSVGSTNYLKANDTTSCSTTDAQNAMPIFLGNTSTAGDLLETTFHNDVSHDTPGDFMFIHSDCTSFYGSNGESMRWNQDFQTSNAGNRPGANCDPLVIDSTNTSQSIVVDKTAPTTGFDWPATGSGPTVISTAGVGVQFDATDNVALFSDSSHDWDLQRKVATWSGSACGTFASDGAAVSGTMSANNQVVSQGLLADGSCYEWTLAATDANGNAATTKTSGIVRVDTSTTLGDQSQDSFETWDLGAGDNLSVNMASGNLMVGHPIVSLPIQGGSVGLSLTYNRQDTSDVGMTPGWRLNMLRRLTINGDGSVTFTDSTGARHTYTSPSTVGTVTTYTRPATLYGTLVKDTSITANEFILTYRDGSKDKFDISGSSGLLVRQEDRFGNGVTLAYTSGQLTSISDTAGSRSIALAWTSGNLTSITDWANVSGGVVQTSGSGNRVTRFFYSGGQLIGWADPLNTSGTCPTGGSHLTCLTYSSGALTGVGKTQTYETFTSGTLGSATRAISTAIAYAGADVTTVTDAEGAASAISHPATWATKIVRPGTPASETTYTRLGTANDAYGRVGSVKRKLVSAQIERTTTFDATYVTEPSTVTDDNGGSLQRQTTYTYVASSLGLISRVDAPFDGTYRHYTDYTYNGNNDVTQEIDSRQGDSVLRTTTRYCYNATTCNTSDNDVSLQGVISNYVDGSKGGTSGDTDDVTVNYQVDPYGQRTRETRYNYQHGGTLLDSRSIGYVFDGFGELTSQIDNYVSGTVTSPSDDVTPNSSTNARTDLTTTYTYDTAGNRVSHADPRRAIETAIGTSLAADDYTTRSVFDALNNSIVDQLPSTPGAGDCAPASSTCRQSSGSYDELGVVRETTDSTGMIVATLADKVGRSLETYEDPYPAGGASKVAVSTYDAAGRVLTSKDRGQVADSSLGQTVYTYDELGRQTDSTMASGSSPDVASATHMTYDRLNRMSTEEAGYGSPASQVTTSTFDPADHVIKLDDEFTCTSSTYDWRGLVLTTVEGQTSGSCTGSGSRTTTNSYDPLGRLTSSTESGGDTLAAPAYDSVGDELSTSSTTAGVTTSSDYVVNPIGQTVAETRSDGGTPTSWVESNYDAAGNPTDRCVWNASPTESCKPIGTTMSPEPAIRTTTLYDARNNRISLKVPGAGETTYSPADDYQVDKVYTPTKLNGSSQVIAEHVTDYGYDTRHRLTSLSQQVCPVTADTHSCTSTAVVTGSDSYQYDDNDNRTQVVESVGGTTTTTNYCYDALNRLVAVKVSSACTSSPSETYVYDVAGNRTQGPVSGTVTNFAYNSQGQLCHVGLTTCGTPNVTEDAAGRTLTWNGWSFLYDAAGRISYACTVSGCGTGDKIHMVYDSDGRRVSIAIRHAGVTTGTTFTYAGDAIAQEVVSGTVTREYVTDEQGTVTKFCDPNCASPTTTYLVTYSGHGDALGVWRINSDGTLTLANSYVYSSWGMPTTTVASGFADLNFRFLYDGADGVQWDDFNLGLGLYYMHARHYSPNIGRFLQPDPSGQEVNLYGYAENSPITLTDPSGLYPWTDAWTSIMDSWNHLTPSEQRFCADPINLLLVCPTISDMAQYARSEENKRFHTDEDGTRANAFKHCTWAACITIHNGAGVAKTYTDAHEAFPQNDPASKRMDLHNNLMGIVIGAFLVPHRYTTTSYHNYKIRDWRREQKMAADDCQIFLAAGLLTYLKK